MFFSPSSRRIHSFVVSLFRSSSCSSSMFVADAYLCGYSIKSELYASQPRYFGLTFVSVGWLFFFPACSGQCSCTRGAAGRTKVKLHTVDWRKSRVRVEEMKNIKQNLNQVWRFSSGSRVKKQIFCVSCLVPFTRLRHTGDAASCRAPPTQHHQDSSQIKWQRNQLRWWWVELKSSQETYRKHVYTVSYMANYWR